MTPQDKVVLIVCVLYAATGIVGMISTFFDKGKAE
jgi:hypothetical protein